MGSTEGDLVEALVVETLVVETLVCEMAIVPQDFHDPPASRKFDRPQSRSTFFGSNVLLGPVPVNQRRGR